MSEAQSKGNESEDQSRHTADPHRARIEWATLLVSAALLLLVAGLLTYAHFAEGERAPALEARAAVDEARRDGEAFHLPVHVHNRGRAGARDVQVRVEFTRPTGASDESIDLTLDLLPPGANETAVVVLRSNPARVPIEARVVSYLTD